MSVNARVSLRLESAEGVVTYSGSYGATVEGDPGVQSTISIAAMSTAELEAFSSTAVRVYFLQYGEANTAANLRNSVIDGTFVSGADLNLVALTSQDDHAMNTSCWPPLKKEDVEALVAGYALL